MNLLLALAILWPLLSPVVGVLLGRGIRIADTASAPKSAAGPDGDAGLDLLADQPTEIVKPSDAEVDERFAAIAAQLRHPSAGWTA